MEHQESGRAQSQLHPVRLFYHRRLQLAALDGDFGHHVALLAVSQLVLRCQIAALLHGRRMGVSLLNLPR